MAKVEVDMSGDNARLNRALAQSDAKVKKLEASLKKTGKAGQKAGKQIKKAADPKAVTGLIGKLTGAGGVVAGLAAVNKGYAVWLSNMREVARRSDTVADAFVPLLALQKGGDLGEIARLVAQTGAKAGLNLKLVPNIVQSIQSARGDDRAAGIRALTTVGRLQDLGVPVPAALEASRLGAKAGLPEGGLPRLLVLAGEASSLSPAILINAAPSLSSFDEEIPLGAAVAAAIGSATKGAGIPERLRGVGNALGDASPALPFFEKHGLGVGASRLDRLALLHELSIDTASELKAIGFGDELKQEALGFVVRDFETVKKTLADSKLRNKEGLLVSQFVRVAKGFPAARQSRQSRVLESEAQVDQLFGPNAQALKQKDIELQIEGKRRRRVGQESFVVDLIDPTGRAPGDPVSFIASEIREVLAGRTVQDAEAGREEIRAEIRADVEARVAAAAKFDAAAEGTAKMNLEASEKNLAAAEKNERAAEMAERAAANAHLRAGGGVMLAPVNDDQGGP